ncbi:uncharacterized protein LOC111940310 [Cyanistes caeruleus]|uniref:uncharacterized protein LOC111940310 n=1 Tax=Cyanistes caeruleus TaxID=156563 RepID=UPI000CDA0FD1|nr:uncharacterized protein LOC111940310 [Cyanistes caeruleus]
MTWKCCSGIYLTQNIFLVLAFYFSLCTATGLRRLVLGVKDPAVIREKLPEAKPPSLGFVAVSEENCGSGTGTGTALGDRFQPWSPVLGESTVDGLVPQPLNPSLVLGPKSPMTQRAEASLSLRHQGDSGDPPQPPPAAAPDAEGSSPLPDRHISISARAQGPQHRRSRTWDPSAASLWALTGLVAPDTGDTGNPGGTPSFLGPRGLPRPTQNTRTECKRPLNSRITSGTDVLSWLHNIVSGKRSQRQITSKRRPRQK